MSQGFSSNTANGNVSDVGTPVDNEVAVFTGPAVIEGDSGFKFDGTKLTIPGQIQFPATVNASSDNNTLDDYEEGTFTCVLTDGSNNATMSQQEGYYTKIGDMVHIIARCTTTSLGSVSGGLSISGLPFTSTSDTNCITGGYVSAGSGFAFTASESVAVLINTSTALMGLRLWDSGAGVTIMQEGEWSSNGSISISGIYRVDS